MMMRSISLLLLLLLPPLNGVSSSSIVFTAVFGTRAVGEKERGVGEKVRVKAGLGDRSSGGTPFHGPPLMTVVVLLGDWMGDRIYEGRLAGPAGTSAMLKRLLKRLDEFAVE
jgi:hypothetical protein